MQENFANILQKIIEADILYEVYELNNDMTFSYSIEEMLEIAKEDFEEFVVDFGEPIFI
jgi:hypothetical protein